MSISARYVKAVSIYQTILKRSIEMTDHEKDLIRLFAMDVMYKIKYSFNERDYYDTQDDINKLLKKMEIIEIDTYYYIT
jgi:hypothetical protein